MAEKWFVELKEKVIGQHPMCWICNKRFATDLHHALVKDAKRHHRVLTVEINMMPVCQVCHVSLEQTANTHEIKNRFAASQLRRGFDIASWYQSLPLKVKEHWLLHYGERK